MRKRVVLPDPLGPTRPTFSPAFSWNEASTKSNWRPYCFPTRVNEIMWSGLPSDARGLGDLLPDQRDLVVAQPAFVQPVRTRDFLEGVNRGLDTFRPRHRYQLDVAVDVTHGEDA